MLRHVSFVTAQPDRITQFYGALGATLTKDLVTAEGYRRLVLEWAGGGKLKFFAIAGETPAPHSHLAEHIALILPDVHGSLTALQRLGVTLSRGVQPSPSGRPMAFVQDPDGRQVGLLRE